MKLAITFLVLISLQTYTAYQEPDDLRIAEPTFTMPQYHTLVELLKNNHCTYKPEDRIRIASILAGQAITRNALRRHLYGSPEDPGTNHDDPDGSKDAFITFLIKFHDQAKRFNHLGEEILPD